MKKNTLLKMSDEQYFSLDYLSSSDVRLFASSLTPKHFLFTKEEKEPTDLMNFGTLVHVLLLSPELFDERFFIISDETRRTEKLKQEVGDKIIIKNKELEAAKTCVANIHAHSEAARLFSGSLFEQVILFDEPFYKTESKAKLDGINVDKNYIFDIKTTSDISFDGFYRTIFDTNLVLQAAFYKIAAESCFQDKNFDFYFIAVENKSPHLCNVFKLSFQDWFLIFEALQDKINCFLKAKKQNFDISFSEVYEFFNCPNFWTEKINKKYLVF